MSAGFTKLSNDILTSSIWSEGNHTRILWITLLASCDATGFVSGSIPGIAQLARLGIEETEAAMSVLMAPDKYSRTKEYEGRRLIECEGGWLIVNYQKYRAKRDPEKRRQQNREAKQRQRAKEKVGCQQDVSQCQPMSAHAEAEAEAEEKHTFDSDAYRLAELLIRLIVERKKDFKKPNPQKWAKHIDVMIRLDKRPPERIEKVIHWCQADSGNGNDWAGWQNNILSTAKLRQKFDILELRMQEQTRKPSPKPKSDPGNFNDRRHEAMRKDEALF